MSSPVCYSFNHSFSLVCSSNSRLRSRRALLKYPFLHKQSIDLSPSLYFSKTFNKSLFMPSGILLNSSHGVFFLAVGVLAGFWQHVFNQTQSTSPPWT